MPTLSRSRATRAAVAIALGLVALIVGDVAGLGHAALCGIDSIRYRAEIAEASEFVEEIAASDAPSQAWLARADTDSEVHALEMFYFFKIGFLLDAIDVTAGARLDAPTSQAPYDGLTVQLRYAGDSVVVLKIRRDPKAPADLERARILARYPLDRCGFDPDLDRDGAITAADLALASQRTSP